jgi:heme exporter protein B
MVHEDCERVCNAAENSSAKSIHNNLWRTFYLTLWFELLLAYRHAAELINPLLFFIMAISLFPLAISPEQNILQTIAPGVIWIVVLLATLLTLERLFRADFHDGSLEQMLLSPHPLAILILAKLLAHWLMSSLPLIALALLSVPLLHLPAAALPTLALSLLLGTPLLILIGAIARALTVGLRHAGLLLTLLALPFYMPILIFSAGSVMLASHGLAANGQLAWLGVLLLLALPLAPPAIAAALRIAL